MKTTEKINENLKQWKYEIADSKTENPTRKNTKFDRKSTTKQKFQRNSGTKSRKTKKGENMPSQIRKLKRVLEKQKITEKINNETAIAVSPRGVSEETVAIRGVDALNGGTHKAASVGVGVSEVENRRTRKRVGSGKGKAEEEEGEDVGECGHGRQCKGGGFGVGIDVGVGFIRGK